MARASTRSQQEASLVCLRLSSFTRTALNFLTFQFSRVHFLLLALMFASSAGNDAIVAVLLQQFANPVARNDVGQNALHLTATAGHVAILDRLLDHMPNSLRPTDNEGRTILHYAVLGEQWALVDRLFGRLGMEDKKMLVRQNDRLGTSPLAYAILKRRVNAVQIFLPLSSNLQIVRAQSTAASVRGSKLRRQLFQLLFSNLVERRHGWFVNA
jgi:ankyrin repeat protein